MEKLYRFRKPKALGKIQVQFRHKPGKWISTGTADMTEAVLWAEDYIRRDLQITRTDVTLREFATGFYDKDDPQNFRRRNSQYNREFDETYYEKRQGYLRNYILPRFGDQVLDSITDVAIEDWFLGLTTLSGRRMSDDMRNKVLQSLEEILQEAHRRGYVLDNQASKVGHVRVRSKPREAFSRQEMDLLYPADDDELVRLWGGLSWAVYFLISRDTGFRPGEVAALGIDSYIESMHGLYSERSMHYRTRTVKNSIKTTGHGLDHKVGILTSQTERLLQRLIIVRQEEGRNYLFFSDEGNLLIPDSSNKHFKSVASSVIDLRGRTQYSLRHSFETDLAGEVEDRVLLDLMAHTKFRKEYDHRSPERILQQLQPVRELLEERANKKEAPDKASKQKRSE